MLDFSQPKPKYSDLAGSSGLAKKAAKSDSDWKSYLRTTRNQSSIIASIIEDNLSRCKLNETGLEVLDWGCCLGGTALALQQRLNCRVVCADVDIPAINYLKETQPLLEISTLKPSEAFPFASARFNVIYGISIFTHLPSSKYDFYLKELQRCVKSDGILIITILGPECLQDFKSTENFNFPTKQVLLESGSWYCDYNKPTKDSMLFSKNSPWGLSFCTHDHIKQKFARYFSDIKIQERFLNLQDTIIASNPVL
jgi:cyclopropane fatty-acyl-phospholipid synthase-like methyltransferase